MVLLVGAGLILRSTQRLFSLPLGFDPAHLAVVQVYGTGLEHGDAVTHRFFDQALEAVRSVPGVVSAVETSQLPLSGDRDSYGVTLADGTGTDGADGAAVPLRREPGILRDDGHRRAQRARAEPRRRRRGAPRGGGERRPGPPALPGSRSTGSAGSRSGRPSPNPYTIVGVVDDVKQSHARVGGHRSRLRDLPPVALGRPGALDRGPLPRRRGGSGPVHPARRVVGGSRPTRRAAPSPWRRWWPGPRRAAASCSW